MTSLPSVTILFDNYPGVPGLRTLWGFSAVIEVAGQKILFDTGSNGRVLLKNMEALGIAVESVDLVFLSHPHWDHIGGLDSILEINPEVTVVLHEGFSKHLIHDLHSLCGELIVVGEEPLAIAPGIIATGLIKSTPPEHAIVIDTEGVTAAISGCAHPGMEVIVERAVSILEKPVDWAIGGFHLMYSDADAIARCIRTLQALEVAYVVPTHCTGDAAKVVFREEFGDRCCEGGVGRSISLIPR